MRAAAALFIALGLLAGAPAGAEERILSFHSRVEVQADGDLLVTESIQVRAEGGQIRRGIYRDLPTVYPHPWLPDLRPGLLAHRVPLKVLGVTRNGEKEPWHTVGQANGRRIYMGAAKVLLDHGVHRYELRYRYSRILKYLPRHDELFWNVTGNGWSFGMDEVSAEVVLPFDPGEPMRLEAYTGYEGQQGRDYSAEETRPGTARFSATRALKPNEGLSVVLGWPKGLLNPPSVTRRLAWALNDFREPLLALLGLILVWGLLIGQWLRHGVDPDPRPLVARFYPPKDLPAAALRWLDLGQGDATGLVATLVQMAVKGRLKLAQAGKAWTLERLPGAAQGPLEQAVDVLFSGRKLSVKTDRDADLPRFRQALVAHTASLAVGYRADVQQNFKRLLPALGTALVLAFLLGLSAPVAPPAVFTGLFSVLVFGALGAWLAKAREAWRPGRLGVLPTQMILSAGAAVLTSLFGLAVSAALAGGLDAWWQALFCAVAGLGLGLFLVWMPRPSEAHQRLCDEIQGFYLYLSKAESARLSKLHPPDETPELFEKYLPYALALGGGKQWGKRFERTLAAAAKAGTYDPRWVSTPSLHRGLNSAAFGSIGSDLGNSLGRQISSASTPPSSSGSGFSGGGGGGGGSGGGGGGGGGGGW